MREGEEAYLAPLWKICSEVHTVPIKRSRVSDIGYWLRSQITGRPFLIERDDSKKMRNLISELVRNQVIDCIHIDQLNMAQFAFDSRSIKNEVNKHGELLHVKQNNGRNPDDSITDHLNMVFDAHNAVWTIVDRMVPNAPRILRPLINLEAKRVKQYEGFLIQRADVTLAVSSIDRRDLLSAYGAVKSHNRSIPPNIKVIPIAVDSTELQPVKRMPNSKNILTLGTLHYPPNADGIRWFIQTVFPLITQKEEDATLTIIGKNPPEDFIRLAEQKPDQIRVTGYVPDLTPYLQNAAVIVIPVRTGSGMRVRILTAFAHAMPVVTTTVGLEGIDATNGKEVLLADTPQQFSDTVIDLLQDTSLQQRLAINGRKLVEEKYDWQVVLDRLDSIYREMQNSRSRGGIPVG